MKVINIKNRNGNKLKINCQLSGADNNQVFLQSYDSIIATYENNVLILDSYYWNYSITTSKYRNQFTGLSTKETKKQIKSGKIILRNLN